MNVFKTNAAGEKQGSAVASTPLKSDGSYQFSDVSPFSADLNTSSNHVRPLLLELSGCTSTYRRFVTGEKDQNISAASSLLSFVGGSASVTSASGTSADQLLSSLEAAGNISAAYSLITSSPELSNKFQQLFSISATTLMNAPPMIDSASVPLSGAEGTTVSMNAQVNHWSATYVAALEWHETWIEHGVSQDQLLSVSSNATWLPNANKQGTRNIRLVVGQSNGAGRVNLAMPYRTKDFPILIADTAPVSLPAISLVGTVVSGVGYTNVAGVSLSMSTGALLADGTYQNCQSLSDIAIIESDDASPTLMPPVSESQWSIHCTVPATQTLSLTLASEGNKTLKIWARDSAGNVTAIPLNVPIRFSTAKPTISSFVLAGGSATTSNPTISISLSATDILGGVSQMQITESSTPGALWVPFSTSSTFTVTQTNGSKVVYVWVRDYAGNISLASTSTITLDFGSPPTVSLSSPTSGSTFAAGQNVHIAWSCSSTNGLSANPARVTYTVDDGMTFAPITSWVPNNGTASTGFYDWALPGGVTTFRLLAECRSAAGVVSSSYSDVINTGGWSIFAGDPAAMSENVSATVALMINDGSYWQSMATDSQGNIFFAKGSTLMKVDALSGLVTRFAGDPNSGAACNMQVGSDPLSSAFNQIGNSPTILGANASRDSIIVSSCGKLWLLQMATRSLTVLNTVGLGWPRYLSRTGSLFYSSSNKLYKVDLTTPNQTPVFIFGNGTCSATSGGIGTDAKLSPVQGANTSNNCAENWFFTNADDSKIYTGCWEGLTGCGSGWRLDWNAAQGKYLVASTTLPWSFQDWDIGFCTPSNVYSRVWCNSRYFTSTRTTFDLTTETWESRPVISPTRLFIRYAASNSGMVSLSSTNILKSYVENADGTISTIQIGGSDIESYGNGSDLTKVAFSSVDDISYARTSGDLAIRTAGGIRRIAMPSYPTVAAQTYAWSNAGSSWNRLTFNPAGSTLMFPINWCGILSFGPYAVSGTSVTNSPNFYNMLGCNSGVRLPHPVADNTPVAGNNFGWENFYGQNDRPLLHSNGKQYFTVKNTSTDTILYSSDRTVIRWIAGRAGPAGYDPLDSGANASTALLNNASWLLEVPAGSPNAGDILMVDGSRLRMVTVTTSAAAPKIIDLLNLATLTGFPAGATITDFWYDSASELSNGTTLVAGSGKMYFATSANAIYRVTPTAVAGSSVTAATLYQYPFTGTNFSGTARIALTPAGLLVSQPNKNRILRVAP